MPASDITSSLTAAVSDLLKQAAATVYCRPALRDLGAALPEDDSILTTALHEAAMKRDAKSFSHRRIQTVLRRED